MSGTEESLRMVYEETGRQLRNNASTRNALLSFVVVGIGATFGIMSAMGSTAPNAIWWVPLFFGTVGTASVMVHWRYNRTALRRQEQLTVMLLPHYIRAQVNGLAPDDSKEARTTKGARIKAWAIDRRLDGFFLATYSVILWFSAFAVRYGAPFGLPGGK